MRPAREGNIPVRVKNSYNPQAPGTLIQKTRDLSEVCVKYSPIFEGNGINLWR
jgi:aspartokinase